MTTKRKVITNFGNYRDAELHVVSEGALDNLTGNTNFPGNETVPLLTQPPSPAPLTPNLTSASADYFTKLKKARSRKDADVIAKDAARVVLEGMLNKWANYVNLAAAGDLTKLITSGFDLNKERQKAGILLAPEGLKVSSPGVGQLFATVDAVDNAAAYKWKIRELDANDLPVIGIASIEEVTTATQLFLADDNRIVSTKRYSVQVVAVGSDRRAVNWADPVYVTIA